MILREDDYDNYITVDENGYQMFVSGWYAGGITYHKALVEGDKLGCSPDTWAIMQYNNIRLMGERLCRV